VTVDNQLKAIRSHISISQFSNAEFYHHPSDEIIYHLRFAKGCTI